MCKFNKKHLDRLFASDCGNEIYTEILSTLNDENMVAPINKGVVVGFSGGADSVLLLSFLSEYKKRSKNNFSILAVHINHSIRGDEADRDEQFSKEFADALNIDFQSVTIDIPAMSKSSGIGLEEAARNARYSVFNDIIRGRSDINTIAVAHNATDNVETVVMNILRGSGIVGVCGIKPLRDNIVRPLIKISKPEIVSFLNSHNIPFVTDSTNQSTDYTRNYIRNEILPLFNRLSNNPEEAFTKLTENLRSDLDYLNTQALTFIESNGTSKISCVKLRQLHPAIFARVISILVHEKTGVFLEEKHINSLRRLVLKDNFSYSLPGQYDFVCERNICSFECKIKENNISKQIFLLNKGENKISGTNLTVYVGEIDKSSLNVYNFSIQAYISSDIIDKGVFLRFKSDGDSYRYNGMTHKLKKVFNDRNIPASERNLIPLICDSQGILTVPGLCEREYAKSDVQKNNTPIIFAYSDPKSDEVEVFTALCR